MNAYKLTRAEYEKRPEVPTEAPPIPAKPEPRRCHYPDTCTHFKEHADGKWYCEDCGWADAEPLRCMKTGPGAGYTPSRCPQSFKLLEMHERRKDLGRQKYCGIHSPSRLQHVRDKNLAKYELQNKAWNERRRAEEQAEEKKRRTAYLAELGFSSEEQAKLALEVGKHLSTTSTAFFLYLANWRDNEEILEWPKFKEWSEAQSKARAFFEGDPVAPSTEEE